MNNYSHERKKKIAEKIQKIKRKNDLIKIFKLIYEENNQITENNNGIFLFFHKLSDETYKKIEEMLKKIQKKKNEDSDRQKINYTPYYKDEFTEQEKIIPKMKLSNMERNIIKRIRYEENMNKENNNVLSDSTPGNVTASEKSILIENQSNAKNIFIT